MMGRALRLQQAILASPGRSVLCFDFDGAPAPIAEHPGDARPHPAALAGLVRCVAVVTGPRAHGARPGRIRQLGARRLIALIFCAHPRAVRRGPLGRRHWPEVAVSLVSEAHARGEAACSGPSTGRRAGTRAEPSIG